MDHRNNTDMEVNLHQLCSKCHVIRTRLENDKQSGKYDFHTFRDIAYSVIEMQNSASSGCHLCAILFAAAKFTPDDQSLCVGVELGRWRYWKPAPRVTLNDQSRQFSSFPIVIREEEGSLICCLFFYLS